MSEGDSHRELKEIVRPWHADLKSEHILAVKKSMLCLYVLTYILGVMLVGFSIFGNIQT